MWNHLIDPSPITSLSGKEKFFTHHSPVFYYLLRFSRSCDNCSNPLCSHFKAKPGEKATPLPISKPDAAFKYSTFCIEVSVLVQAHQKHINLSSQFYYEILHIVYTSSQGQCQYVNSVKL